jgi:NADH:ubiquinone oxidoreductase subunit 3 (subunit A)
MEVGQIGLISGLALLNGLILLGLSKFLQWFFGIASPAGVKTEVYECGMKSEMGAQVQFDIKYYLFAIMFIILDVEFVFLMPWANLFNMTAPGARTFIMIEAFIFVAILGLGIIYAWNKGALNWDQD